MSYTSQLTTYTNAAEALKEEHLLQSHNSGKENMQSHVLHIPITFPSHFSLLITEKDSKVLETWSRYKKTQILYTDNFQLTSEAWLSQCYMTQKKDSVDSVQVFSEKNLSP